MKLQIMRHLRNKYFCGSVKRKYKNRANEMFTLVATVFVRTILFLSNITSFLYFKDLPTIEKKKKLSRNRSAGPAFPVRC